jgi:hypothetical protein
MEMYQLQLEQREVLVVVVVVVVVVKGITTFNLNQMEEVMEVGVVLILIDGQSLLTVLAQLKLSTNPP